MEQVNNPNTSVSKISKKDLKQEKAIVESENDTLMNDLIEAALALSIEDIRKAIAFIRKKREILKKVK